MDFIARKLREKKLKREVEALKIGEYIYDELGNQIENFEAKFMEKDHALKVRQKL